MLCEDINQTDYLDQNKRFDLIDQLEGDKIGLVIFNGEIYTQLPITSDYSALKMFLSTVNTKSIKTQGTNLSKPITEVLSHLILTMNLTNQLLLLLMVKIMKKELYQAKILKGKGVFIHTLNVGEENGGPIPLLNKRGFKKDRERKYYSYKTKFTFLSELANVTNGININANNSNIGLKKLFKEINKLEKRNK